MRLVGAVNLRIRKGQSDCVHRVGHGSCGWGSWICRLGLTETVKAAATGAATATPLMRTAGPLSVMKLRQVLNRIELLIKSIGH